MWTASNFLAAGFFGMYGYFGSAIGKNVFLFVTKIYKTDRIPVSKRKKSYL